MNLTSVYYKRMIEGVTVPSIIHNGIYCYHNMPVYEDGSFDCWNRRAFAELENELTRGWLVTEIPTGGIISIHGLGRYTIKNAVWEHTNTSYAHFIRETVQSMNSDMLGLYQETAEQKEKWKARKVSWCTHEKVYKVKGAYGYFVVDGKCSSLFIRNGSTWELTSITAYGDGTLGIGKKEACFTLHEIQYMFSADILRGAVDGEFEMLIPRFARLCVSSDDQVGTAEKQKEVEDIWAQMVGEKSLHQICHDAYIEYLVRPTERSREMLRIAYENMPKHQRKYLGDMDTMDTDYQRILYHPEIKRQV